MYDVHATHSVGTPHTQTVISNIQSRIKNKMVDLNRLFPNAIEVASYHPFSRFIKLTSIDHQQYLDNHYPKIKTQKSVEILGTLIHELTHWIDHHSTLWGHDNLLKLFNALSVRSSENINSFWRILDYNRSCKEDLYFEYYTQIFNPIIGGIDDKWKYKLTIGQKFNSAGARDPDKPLLFTRFSSSKGEEISRVPFTIHSILESNAINHQYDCLLESASAIEDVVEKANALRKFQKDILELFYNPHLTIYNVNTHLVANLNSQVDVAITLKQAARIGSIVLNLPDEISRSIKFTTSDDKVFDEHIIKGIESCDKGILFYVLVKNLVNIFGQNSYSLENVLKASGLPSSEEIKTEVTNKMKQNIHDLEPGPFRNYAISTMQYGIDLFSERGISGQMEKVIKKVTKDDVMPDIMFGDTLYDESEFNLKESLQQISENREPNIGNKYYLYEYYEAKFREFVEACI